MTKERDSIKRLTDVFSDAPSHQLVAEIIRQHLTNSRDVRREALNSLDLSGIRTILDLGCGFGFFTEGLQGRVHPEASATGIDMHGRYRKYYLQACEKAGIKGGFRSGGVSAIREYGSESYGLILCSYALYFFPEFIPEIARVIKKDGFFIIITHARPHMREFTAMIREILASRNILYPDVLPYEMLIDRFSDANGKELLAPWFAKVVQKKYVSEIVFEKKDYESLAKYFRFKHSFFMPGNDRDERALTEYILKNVKDRLDALGALNITKDDAIYVCSEPVTM